MVIFGRTKGLSRGLKEVFFSIKVVLFMHIKESNCK